MLQPAPWWLREESEQCDFCLRRHPWEDQCRCSACDVALCSLCAETGRPRASVLCPGCVESGGG
jgi:hypothetical protein